MQTMATGKARTYGWLFLVAAPVAVLAAAGGVYHLAQAYPAAGRWLALAAFAGIFLASSLTLRPRRTGLG